MSAAGLPEPGLSPRPSKISSILRKVFSFPAFMGACLVLGAFAASSSSDLALGKAFVEGDTWWHLVVGEHILSTHTLPTIDTYSFTVHGTPWLAYEWLSDVPMALAERWMGLRGLAVILIILTASLTLLLYYYAWLCSGNVKAAAVACIAVLPLASTFFTLRPQLAGCCFLLITLILLEYFRRGRLAALWALPGIFLIWVNAHGSFIIGLIVLAIFWLCGLWTFQFGSVVAERWTAAKQRRFLLVILLCLLALFVNPYGTHLPAYPLEMALHQRFALSVFTDWLPLNFSTSYGLWFLVFLLAAWLWQLFFPQEYRLEILAFLLFTVIESCLHRRFLVFFAMAFIPVLAGMLARWMPPYEARNDHPVANAVLIGLALSVVVACIPSSAKMRNALAKGYPAGAVEYLRQHPIPSGMFNEDIWGGFLLWSLDAEHRVFIDGRADIYEHGGVLADYVRIVNLQSDPRQLLQRYGIKACLLHRKALLVTFLSTSPQWQRVYEDEISTIFVRNEATE